ncbi:IS66 Orf2 family protein, partial [Rhizobium sp. PDO1-076]
MYRLDADLKVYLHREPIDFRAGINSLAVLVQEVMALEAFPQPQHCLETGNRS